MTEARTQTSEIRIRTYCNSVLMSGFRLLSGRSPDGAIAQLGERLLCKQEVVGSIPSGSTNLLVQSIRIALAKSRNSRAAMLPADCFIFYIVKRGST